MALSKLLLTMSLLVAYTLAFASLSRTFHSKQSMPTTTVPHHAPFHHQSTIPSLQRQRKSVAAIQLQGLFGLGAPEIAIIAVAAAFLLGPQKIAEFGRDAGKIASELKEVPKEFQKGLEEGETNARAVKAKNMADLPQEISESKKE